MKFLIKDKQIKFFKDNGFIEFSDFFLNDERNNLFEEIKQTISKKLNTNINNADSLDIYKNSRDLFRSSKFIKSFDLSRNLSQISYALSNLNSLQLAFDQSLIGNVKSFFKDSCSINDLFCFKGLEIIILIKLDDSDFEIKDDLLSIKPNNIIFLNPNKIINFKPYFDYFLNFFLIGYARSNNLMYIENKNDINLHLIKKMGYGFGDNLKNNNFPIIASS
ncbi:MAG: hypothetical protein K1060chlam5_00532 [Candidatus Anoxychlamydiales bacterium]|nr:hypothetical protein [Candidatus Anoxychlamydiales bacterium]